MTHLHNLHINGGLHQQHCHFELCWGISSVTSNSINIRINSWAGDEVQTFPQLQGNISSILGQNRPHRQTIRFFSMWKHSCVGNRWPNVVIHAYSISWSCLSIIYDVNLIIFNLWWASWWYPCWIASHYTDESGWKASRPHYQSSH